MNWAKLSILMLGISQICLYISITKILKRISQTEKRIERDEGHLWYYIAKVERSTAKKTADNKNEQENKQ